MSDQTEQTRKVNAQWIKKRDNYQKRLIDEASRSANKEADFLSEFALSLRRKERIGLADGAWIEEPDRLYSDGCVFGEEAKSVQLKLQIALCIDVSASTYNNNVAHMIGQAVIGLDMAIRRAAMDLPEGAITYQVFAFNRNTYRVSQADVKNFAVTEDGCFKWGYFTTTIQGRRYEHQTSQALNTLILKSKLTKLPHIEYEDDWMETYLFPLFLEIKKWEGENDANIKLDIILTDGQFDDADDIHKADMVQDRRDGKITTIVLNFLKRDEWKTSTLPNRCLQYEANGDNLGNQIKQILSRQLTALT